MTPRALLIENFGPFKGKPTEIRFPQGPGLFFLWGDNRAEPRLEGNAAGKSSIWNALTWVFFGKTTRGLKAGDAANWDVTKGSSVQLEFSDPKLTGTMPGFIKRTWSPNSWTYQDLFGTKVDLAADETNPITEALRLSFTAFMNSVLMAQGQPMFLDLRPDAKAALFSDVMGLEKWIERSKKASTLAGIWDDDLRVRESELAGIDGQLRGMETDDHLLDQSVEWERARVQRRAQLRETYQQLIVEEQSLQAGLEKLLDARDEAADVVKAERVAAGAAAQAAAACEEALRSARKVRDEAKGAVDAMERSIAFLEANERCPTCGSEMHGPDHAHLLERDGAMDDYVNLDREVLALEEAQTTARTQSRVADDALADARFLLNEAAAKVQSQERRLIDIDQECRDLEARDDEILAEVNPWEAMAQRAVKRRADLISERGHVQRLVEFADAQRTLYGNWVKWHKEIRLQMISDALLQLELEVNAEASALGLIGWELRFDVDREGKNGNMQRGFMTTVLSPHNDRPVPWEAWSGGESQRLRAAAQMGLSNLIRRRTGATIPLEVWDEPTQWLSPQGVEDLLIALGERAQRERLQIWVVDHRSLGHGGFTGQMGVVKELTTGSRCVEGSYSSAQVPAKVYRARRKVSTGEQ